MFKNIKSKNASRYLAILALLISTILAAFFRFNQISAHSFWYDEAFTGILVKQDLSTLFATILQNKDHPPGYYILSKLFSEIFGFSDFSLRLLPVILGVLLVCLSYFFVSKIFGKRAGIISALIFTVSPFFILYSIEARPYALLAIEVIVCIFLFLRIVSRDSLGFKSLFRDKYFRLLILTSFALLLTHYLSILILAPVYGLILLKILPFLRKPLYIFIIGIISLLLIKLVITGETRIIPASEVHTKWLSDPIPQDLGEMLYTFTFGVETQALGDQEFFKLNNVNNYEIIFIVILFFSLSLAIWQYNKSKDYNLKNLSQLFLLTCAVVMVISFFGINFFLSRYLIPLGIIYVVWISVSLSKAKSYIFVPIILIYLLLLTQVRYVNGNKNYIELAKSIENVEQRVVLKSPFDFLTIKYYLNGSKKIYFLDNEQTRMHLGPWPFFERNEVLSDFSEEDYLID